MMIPGSMKSIYRHLLLQDTRHELDNGVKPRAWNPWDSVNLTKSERRGKSYQEQQELRKTKWEQSMEVVE